MPVYIDTCPNNCSEHGTCMDMSDASILRSGGMNAEEITTTIYSSNSSLLDKLPNSLYQSPYVNWDAASIYMCTCDSGYFGPDCSLSKALSVRFLVISS